MKYINKRNNNLVGIIPIAYPKSIFNMPWHDCLMPIAEDYSTLEHAVFTCALAGCKSIWIIGHMNMQPIIRKKVGEMIIDPLTYYSTENLNFTRHDKSENAKEIQIYYLPIHPKDRDKKDSLAYSVIYAAENIVKLHAEMSRWAIPDKFFCCFPNGIVSQKTIYKARPLFANVNNVSITHDGKTIKNDVMLPFSFSLLDFRRCKNLIKEFSLNIWENSDTKKTPSVIHFSLSDVFSNVDFSKAEFVQADSFCEFKCWDDYKTFMKSDFSDNIKKYKNLFLTTKRSEFLFGEENE